MRRAFAAAAVLALSGVVPAAQTATPAVQPPAQAARRAAGPLPLTVDSIMRGPTLVGYPPSGLRWAGDGSRLFFEWRQPGDHEPSTWVVARDGSGLRRLDDEARRSAPPVQGVWDAARRRVLAVDQGDIVLIDSVAGTRREITRTTGAESNPRWARADTHVTFVRDNNLFVVPVDGGGAGLLVQLTDVAAHRPDPSPTDVQAWLKAEEQRLLDAVREAAERRARREEQRKKRALPKFTLAERQSIADARLSHDGRYAWLLVTERPARARTTEVPSYVTESAYKEDLPSRTKAGDVQGTRRLAILDLEKSTTAWAALEPSVAGADYAGPGAAARPTAPPAKDAAKPARGLQWAVPLESHDASLAVTVVTAADNKDRWIVAVDPATGSARVIDHLHDEAWVRPLPGFGGFGGGGAAGARGLGFVGHSTTLWFLSERDGWMHLYVVDAADPHATPRALTAGAWEVTRAALSLDATTFFLTTTEVHAGERQVFTMPATGGPRQRLTTAPGAHEVVVSPDGARLADIHSTSRRPPEVFLADARPGASLERVTTSPSDEWLTGRWVEPELVTFAARDGVRVPARLYTPEMVGARRARSRPAVVFVHGAGYLQNAHRYWSSYFREYMFHHLLASKGYVVLDVDYRGSAGYGRDWRTAIYRHMGGKDLDDIVDGARYLVEAHGVDRRRIGVYGGSYGGFITLMAMFTAPDVFAAGAALRPVTDWAHYSHGYTSDILNVPAIDPEAYRRSSPIYFAGGLKGALLICHGLVDVNVHAQDSIRLAQRLIELRKDNWELALYPVEDHGFERETSWADEYRRILELFETHLRPS